MTETLAGLVSSGLRYNGVNVEAAPDDDDVAGVADDDGEVNLAREDEDKDEDDGEVDKEGEEDDFPEVEI